MRSSSLGPAWACRWSPWRSGLPPSAPWWPKAPPSALARVEPAELARDGPRSGATPVADRSSRRPGRCAARQPRSGRPAPARHAARGPGPGSSRSTLSPTATSRARSSCASSRADEKEPRLQRLARPVPAPADAALGLPLSVLDGQTIFLPAHAGPAEGGGERASARARRRRPRRAAAQADGGAAVAVPRPCVARSWTSPHYPLRLRAARRRARPVGGEGVAREDEGRGAAAAATSVVALDEARAAAFPEGWSRFGGHEGEDVRGHRLLPHRSTTARAGGSSTPRATASSAWASTRCAPARRRRSCTGAEAALRRPCRRETGPLAGRVRRARRAAPGPRASPSASRTSSAPSAPNWRARWTELTRGPPRRPGASTRSPTGPTPSSSARPRAFPTSSRCPSTRPRRSALPRLPGRLRRGVPRVGARCARRPSRPAATTGPSSATSCATSRCGPSARTTSPRRCSRRTRDRHAQGARAAGSARLPRRRRGLGEGLGPRPLLVRAGRSPTSSPAPPTAPPRRRTTSGPSRRRWSEPTCGSRPRSAGRSTRTT